MTNRYEEDADEIVRRLKGIRAPKIIVLKSRYYKFLENETETIRFFPPGDSFSYSDYIISVKRTNEG